MLQQNVADNLILFQSAIKAIYCLNETCGHMIHMQ